MDKSSSAVYILTNRANKVLYTGSTVELVGRVWKHKTKFFLNAFTAKYNVDKLVYFEIFDRIENAAKREKQIKAGSRQKKIDLINSMNPKWKDLSEEWYERFVLFRVD